MKDISPRAKLIAGIMYSKEEEYERAVKGLKAEFGAVEAESETFPFDFKTKLARDFFLGVRTSLQIG